MSRAKQVSRDRLGIGMRRAFRAGLLLLLLGAPAEANQIVQVRVGNHPSFTRIVFEMDAFAGYQVERRTGIDGVEQLTVTLEASTPKRDIKSNSVGIESVRLAEGTDHAVAQIRLRKPGLQMKEMILSNPPRIVLDFVHSAAAVAELTGDPYAKPVAAEPKPVVAKVVEPKPEPKPVVAKVVEPKPEPKPVIAKVVEPKPEPEPVIAKVVEPKPEPKPVVAKVVEPKPEPEPVIAKVVESKPEPVVAKVEPKPEPVSVPVDPADSAAELEMADSAPGSEAAGSPPAAEADRRAALRDSIPGVHKRHDLEPPTDSTAESAPSDSTQESASEQVADAADTNLTAPPDASPRILLPANDEAQRRVPSPSDINRQADKPKAADSGLPFSTLTLAGIVAGVLAVLFIAVRLFRKRSLPQNLDVTTFTDAFDDDDAATSDAEAGDQVPAEEFAIYGSPTRGAAPEVEERNTAAYSLSEVAANRGEPEIGLYTEDSEGEKPMDMGTTDLPTERDDFSVPPGAMMGRGDSDLSQLVQELASRIANLETRLDEANDSRERLERQVAAQSEELRVQRAAIARTQRALRSLSRSEEEQATEPALREPSQPAK